MSIFTFKVRIKYEIGNIEKTSTLKVYGNDEKHAIHNAEMQLNTHVMDRDTSSVGQAAVPDIKIISSEVV